MPLTPQERAAAEGRLREVQAALLKMRRDRACNLQFEEELNAERKRLDEVLGRLAE